MDQIVKNGFSKCLSKKASSVKETSPEEKIEDEKAADADWPASAQDGTYKFMHGR